MAYRIIKNGDTTPGSVVEIIADELTDIAELPTADEVGVGSDCLCLEDSSVRILGNDGEWHQI